MTSKPTSRGLSLHDAARAMGVTFAEETVPEDGFIDVNDTRFHYLEWGQPSSPPMLLLHGFAQTCHSWDFVSLSLCDRFRVISLDQRGHGDTDWASDGDYSPEAYQRDLEAVVVALGLKDIVLMGLSMGARNAFTYASLHPDRVRALIVVDAAPETMRVGSENIRQFIRQEDELDSLDAFVERIQSFNPRRSAEQIRGSVVHNLKELPNGKWTWKYDKRLRSADRKLTTDPELAQRLWGYLEAVQCPTLIVRGADSDMIALDTADRMQQRVPNSQVATVEKAGHLVTGDNPSGFERAVSTFLGELG